MTIVSDPVKVNPEQRMLIDGKLVDADSGKTFDNVNPATEEVIGQVADASTAEMQRAIDGSRRAFDETDWSTNHAFRKRCLEQLHEALQAEQEELREQLILEVGCPRMTTNGPQLDAPLADALSYPAKLIDEFPWETVLPDAINLQGSLDSRRIWREPVGVVGAIVPWNFPFEVTSHKLGQALATGNTVVLKPAPDTPWNATFLGRLIAEQTDIPPGVVNIVTSSDHLIGEELTLSPKVDMISFTGSTAVGQRIMEKGAATMKRSFLELGGKSATIVLEDADLGFATLMGMGACFHAGQGCAIQTRMLLPRSRYEEGVELLKGLFAAVPYGDPQRPDVIMGPVISSKQRERVLDQSSAHALYGRSPVIVRPIFILGGLADWFRSHIRPELPGRPGPDARTSAVRSGLRACRMTRGSASDFPRCLPLPNRPGTLQDHLAGSGGPTANRAGRARTRISRGAAYQRTTSYSFTTTFAPLMFVLCRLISW